MKRIVCSACGREDFIEDDCVLFVCTCGFKNAPGVHKNDPVNHPSHYTDGKIEVIDYIEDKGFNYHLGQAIKYISRAGKKDPEKYTEDLKKAIWFLNREVERNGK